MKHANKWIEALAEANHRERKYKDAHTRGEIAEMLGLDPSGPTVGRYIRTLLLQNKAERLSDYRSYSGGKHWRKMTVYRLK